MPKRMKIYLSGPVSGTPDYAERFADAEALIIERFPDAIILNPVSFIRERIERPEHESWHLIMGLLIQELLTKNFTHIFLLPNWTDSPGAIIEYGYSKKIGLEVLK